MVIEITKAEAREIKKFYSLRGRLQDLKNKTRVSADTLYRLVNNYTAEESTVTKIKGHMAALEQELASKSLSQSA